MLRVLLPLTALAVSLAFFPLWEGGGLSPRWMVLAVLSAACTTVTQVRMTPMHWLGAAYLAYATLSLWWTPQLAFAIEQWAMLVMMAGIFIAAAEIEDDEWTYWLWAIGISVSGFVAMTQAAGFTWVPDLVGPSGLFVNKNYLSEAAAVTLVIVLAKRWWWLVPGPLVGLLLSHSRGALAGVIATGLVWVWHRSKLASGLLAGLCIAGAIWSTQIPPTVRFSAQEESHDASSFYHRLGVWGPTLRHMSVLGYGEGSFYTVYPTFLPHVPLALTRPEHAHNEVIDVLCELGLPGLALFGAFWWLALRGADATEFYASLCLLAIGVFSFPLHLPATCFLAALMAGRCAHRSRDIREPAWAGGGERAAGLSSA